MKDSIFVEGLHLRGKHGVRERERQNEQEFLVDIRAEFDARAAAKSDNIGDALNYEHFCKVAREAVEHNSFHLIERLADTIAQGILGDLRITRVEVTVRKPAALPSGVPGVRIVRTRS